MRQSAHNLVFREFQQELLGAGIAELHRCLGVLARSLNLQHRAYAKTLVLYHVAFLNRRIR